MIRLANELDLPAVATIYEAILDHEDATGIHYTGWQRGAYPTADTARRPRASISMVLALTERTPTPSSRRISIWMITSRTMGTFSMRHTPSTRMAAGMMATTAFFAPLTVTSPKSGLPPRITYLSKEESPLLSYSGPRAGADRFDHSLAHLSENIKRQFCRIRIFSAIFPQTIGKSGEYRKNPKNQ